MIAVLDLELRLDNNKNTMVHILHGRWNMAKAFENNNKKSRCAQCRPKGNSRTALPRISSKKNSRAARSCLNVPSHLTTGGFLVRVRDEAPLIIVEDTHLAEYARSMHWRKSSLKATQVIASTQKAPP